MYLHALCILLGDSLCVSSGQVVHKDCRRSYCHPNIKRKGVTEIIPSSPRTRQTGKDAFNFETKCFFCGTHAQYDHRKRGTEVFRVKTLEFQQTVKEHCKTRNDEWGNVVLGRLEYAQDLPAVEARYHSSCSSNFRTGYNIPVQFQACTDDFPAGLSSRKKGRPTKTSAENAFKQVIEYFESNSENLISLYELISEMKVLCGDEAYSVVYMKKKIIEHFGGAVMISEMNGRKDVVTFRSTADAVLYAFYKKGRDNDIESEKAAIIKTAAKLVLNDIKDIEASKIEYPSTEEIMSVESNQKCVPESLHQFLNQIIDHKKKERKVISLAQAIVQAAVPRKLIAPLQLGLGVQMHHQFGSKSLIDTLNSLGFCSSYQEIQRFETSAAVTQGIEMTRKGNQFTQFVADNVDHNTASLDGNGTFHGMGIISATTPKVEHKSPILRIHTTSEDLIAVGKIHIQFYEQKCNNMDALIFERLALPMVADRTGYSSKLKELETAHQGNVENVAVSGSNRP